MSSQPSNSAPAGLPWPEHSFRATRLPAGTRCDPLPPECLCVLGWGSTASGHDARRIEVPLPSLLGGADEVWTGGQPVRNGWAGDIGYSDDGEVLLLQMTLPEPALHPMEDAVCRAYERIQDFLARHGGLHLWRVWHYLGSINEGEGDDERYRRFCVGRHRAVAGPRGFEAALPAATAIGMEGGGLLIFAVAGRRAGLQVENPRQVSAFRYPRDYGPISPSFSRATLLPWADGASLLVSGTSSIVGHVSLHEGDAAAQLRQTADNLQALAAHAPRAAGLPALVFRPESFTVYLRREDDLAAVAPLLPALFGDTPLQVLRGDVCRRELLVEVEAVYRAAPA